MSTEKLYYKDSHISEFEATVTKVGDGFIVLDKTAFFPEGGGQMADTGYINGIKVEDVHEKEGEIRHYLNGSFNVGDEVKGILDFDERIRRMRLHSAEHIVSGLVNKLYGFNNVGFHLRDIVTLDFDGELDDEKISLVEMRANEAVMKNVPIKTYFPKKEEIEKIPFRAKLETDKMENLRIVEIEGIDICACCAPHVKTTGEIGILKILSADRHRGGMRLTMSAGLDAYNIFDGYQRSVVKISGMLSSKREEVSNYVKNLKDERDTLKFEKGKLEEELVTYMPTDEAVVFADLSDAAQRKYCNILMDHHKIAAVFCGEKFIIGSKSVNLKEKAKEICTALNGRGGGRQEMITGTAKADKEIVYNYFANLL